MDDLVAFLKARLDQRELWASTAAMRKGPAWAVAEQRPFEWGVEPDGAEILASGKPILRVNREYGAGIDPHIAANDPAYVLAEVAAKRQLIELHGFTDGGWIPGEDRRCTECGWVELAAGVGQRGAQRQWPCRTLRLLAAPFAAHPDYQARWAL